MTHLERRQPSLDGVEAAVDRVELPAEEVDEVRVLVRGHGRWVEGSGGPIYPALGGPTMLGWDHDSGPAAVEVTAGFLVDVDGQGMDPGGAFPRLQHPQASAESAPGRAPPSGEEP